MKIKIFTLVMALFGVIYTSTAQNSIVVNHTITSDEIVATLQNNILGKSVSASGQAVFSQNSGYVRILLSDDYDTLTLSMNGGVGISDFKFSNNISIYPNPIKDILNLDIPENITVKSISIYSIDGKLIEKDKYFFNLGQLSIGNLEKGSYTINIKTDKGNFNKLIIKN